MSRYCPLILVLIATLLVGAAPTFGSPIYVKTAATGTGDGSSWANAMGSVQAALNLASSSERSVWVAGGSYDPGATLDWPSNAKAFGGFHDGDTLFNQRDIAGNPSVITGANTRRVINVNSVVNTRIDGFTITNGRANWGGGIRCDALDNSNIIANCRIQNCVAPDDYGGGMVSNGCSGHIIENSVFDGNTSSSLGGGLFMHQSDAVVRDSIFSNNRNANWGGAGVVVMSATAATRIERCTFMGNHVEGGGGRGAGLYIEAATWHDSSRLCQISVVNCRFEDNRTRADAPEGGGGAMAVINASPSVRNCYFSANGTQNHGGAVLVRSQDATRTINATFEGCVIHANWAGWNSAGGGFHLSADPGTVSNVTINNSSLTNNHTIGDGSGGGIWTGPRVVLRINGTTFRDNTTFHDTYPGGHGGGIMADGASADVALDRCTFIGNNVWHPTIGYWGGGLFSHGGAHVQAWNTAFDRNGGYEAGGAGVHGSGSKLWLFYCTFTGNNRFGARAASGGELVTTNSIYWGNDTAGVRWDGGTSGWSAYCNTQDGHGGTGNISSAPLLVDWPNGNQRLTAASPCRNAGDPDNNAWPPYDILNNVRPFDGRRDMGAYEWNNSPAPTVLSIAPRTGEANPARTGTVLFTVTFDKGIGGQITGSLSGLTPANFSLTTTGSISGASIDRVTGSGTTRTVLVNTGTGSGTIRLALDNSTNVACSGNLSLSNAPFTAGSVYTIDKTPPLVNSLTCANANPNSGSTVDFNVTFSESVTGVSAAAFNLITAGVTGASITGVSGTTGATRLVTVDTGTGDGTVAIGLRNGAAIFDSAGNMLTNWVSADSAVYTMDKTPPTVTSILRQTPAAQNTNANSVTWRVTFNEDVGGSVAASDFTITKVNAADPIDGFSVDSVAPVSGTTYDVTCDTGTGDGLLRLDILVPPADIRDLANNSLATSFTGGDVYAIDKTPPSLGIGSPAPAQTHSGPAVFTVTYDDTGSGLEGITLAVGDVTVNATGDAAANGVAVDVGGTANQRVVTLSDLTGDGTLAITIAAGTAIDIAGNSAVQTGPSAAVAVDNTPPTTTLSADIAVSEPTDLATIPMRVIFDENVFGFALGDLALVNAAASDFTIISPSEYTFDLLPASQGLFSVTVPAGAAQDATGNGNLASDTFSRTFASARPTVSLTSGAPNPTNTTPIPVTVTFGAPVTGFTQGALVIVNAAIANFSGSDGNYSFDLLPTGQGAVSAQVPANVAQDGLGAWNTASNTLVRVYDTAPPTVELNTTAPDPTNAPIPVTATFNEPVSGFSADDIAVSNATVTSFVGGDGDEVFTFILTPLDPTGTSLITASVVANVATDLAGNLNLAAPDDVERTYDGVAPTMSSVVVIDPLAVLVTFDKAMGPGADNAANYAVSGAGRGTLSNHPAEVQQQSATAFLLLWALPNEMFDGGELTVTVNNAYDLVGNLIAPPNSGTGTAISIPPIAQCVGEITLELDATGNATLRPEEVDNGSDDNVGIVVWLLDGNAEVAFDCADIGTGPHTVTLRVEDAAGNADECTTEVTVEDNLPPVITIPGANPRYLLAGMMFAPPTVTAVDNCDGQVSVTLLDDGGIAISPDTLVLGEYTLLYEATDSVGNVATTELVVVVQPAAPIIVSSTGEQHFTRVVGQSVTFAVEASGGAGGALQYQWYRVVPDKSLSLIINAEDPAFTIDAVALDDAGEYVCVVSDISGSGQSDPFTLEVSDTALPAVGLFGLALAAALATLATITRIKKQR